MRLSAGVVSTVLVLLAAATPTLASDKYGKPYAGYKREQFAKPDYNYAYGIKDKYSGVNVDVKENRYGDKTEGQYVSALPDGRKQKVSYYVDGKSGFVAKVEYAGVAKHPIPKKKFVKPIKYGSHKQYKPLLPPHKPLPFDSHPVKDVQLGYGDDDYDSYGQGYPKYEPHQDYDHQDYHPGSYEQHRSVYKQYEQGQFHDGPHKPFQQHYPH